MESIESLGGIASSIFWVLGLLALFGMLFILCVIAVVVAVRWSRKKGIDLTDGINAEELEMLRQIILDAEKAEKEAALKEKLSAVVVDKKK
ncbi:MAG: hypothetical protein ACK5XN_09665 [Bacteroidota bacterium]